MEASDAAGGWGDNLVAAGVADLDDEVLGWKPSQIVGGLAGGVESSGRCPLWARTAVARSATVNPRGDAARVAAARRCPTTSTQSSAVSKRCAMLARASMMSGNFLRTLPQPSSRVLCTLSRMPIC